MGNLSILVCMNEIVPIDKKTEAMIAAGATREAAWKAVVAGLTAKKLTVDKFGEEHYEEDTTNQLRSAELIARGIGDLKPETLVDNRQVSINVSNISKEVFEGLIDMVSDVKKQLAVLKQSGHQTGEIIDIAVER